MRPVSDKRTRILDGAKSLLHRKGFSATSLADVAEEAGVPLGNMYYYYRTKESLADAVVTARLGELEQMLEEAGQAPRPEERIGALLSQTEARKEELARHGCPFGCLAQDLDRVEGPLSRTSAALLERQLSWLCLQFEAMGYPGHEAGALGLELQAGMHGAIVLAHCFHDPQVVRRRFDSLALWVHDRAKSVPS